MDNFLYHELGNSITSEKLRRDCDSTSSGASKHQTSSYVPVQVATIKVEVVLGLIRVSLCCHLMSIICDSGLRGHRNIRTITVYTRPLTRYQPHRVCFSKYIPIVMENIFVAVMMLFSCVL